MLGLDSCVSDKRHGAGSNNPFFAKKSRSSSKQFSAGLFLNKKEQLGQQLFSNKSKKWGYFWDVARSLSHYYICNCKNNES